MKPKTRVAFNGSMKRTFIEPPSTDVWVNASGKPFKLKDMSTDHLVNAVSALLRDQLRKELGLDRTRYAYIPNTWAQNETVARALYKAMASELRRRKELS